MRFLAKQIYIDKFRKISDLELDLGNKITVFSGINGVGKSNILSLIAMMFGTSGTRIAKGNFIPQFDEYFIITEDEYLNQDQAEDSKYKAYIKVETDEGGLIQKRIGLKNDSSMGRGIRVLPRSTNYYTPDKTVREVTKNVKSKYDIGDSSKIPVPAIFISLSRLFPMGETDIEESNITNSNKLVTDKIIDQYISYYNRVLPGSISESYSVQSKIKKDVNRNGRLFVELKNSNARTQSIGEDNLGSIISALADFYYLKKKSSSEYNGGILFIDEVDASLHPSAQNELFNLLDELSDELNLQIFLTTHSMTILEKIIKKQNKDPQAYKLNYILDPNIPRLKKNIVSINDIKADLYEMNSFYAPKIKVYCEDKETKFIFEQLIKVMNKSDSFKLPYYEIFNLSLGHTQLEGLRKFDDYFERVVILVDGDAKGKGNKNLLMNYINKDVQGLNSKDLADNVLSLPTFLAPESYYYYILNSIKDDRKFWTKLDEFNLNSDYTSKRIIDILDKVKSDEDGYISNENIKKVFDDQTKRYIKAFIEDTQVFNYFYSVNIVELENFREKTLQVFNIIDTRMKAAIT
ncbi:ATP-dependent nuclease [Anaerococcus sp.]|uniref:ATP-dependent nuclease n=1 Tax=Anaerococcus sp. TaxID=1872515 RepID=UPI002900A0B0|nr:AAA family ATPase [Anaerococcus sp.]MDU1828560.1 AAA family ATPase [Anaerococcus sp.]MDU1865143.1 AAA family ATPase [Anaerococcus sp.]MDU2566466.1 AAA family ATPase [Anaerococcus sp.]